LIGALLAALCVPALLLGAGCRTADEAVVRQGEPEIPAPDDIMLPVGVDVRAPGTHREYLVGPGDVLAVSVWMRQDLSRETPVRPDGTLFVPLAGNVPAAGRTPAEIAKDLTERLSRYLRNPQVDVVVTEYGSRSFTVLGELRQPGDYPVLADTDLLGGIAAAGGFNEEANLAEATIVRDGSVLPIDFYGLFRRGRTGQNIYLADGDFIYVPSRETSRVYVLGEVNQPQVVQVTEGSLTVGEAVARAGGFDENTAFKANLKVIRGGLGDPEVYTVDFNRVLRGEQADSFLLRSGDIVFVPASGIAKWDRILSQLLPNLSRIIVDAAAVQSLTK